MPRTAHHVMLRSEKEITNPEELESILTSAQVCRLAMVDQDTPYIVPLHFGYRNNVLYFHCALKGRKLDIISRNPFVCFEVETDHGIINTGRPCDWSSRYASVIGYGVASLLIHPSQKKEALAIIVDHYAPGTKYDFEEKKVNDVTILKVEISSMTGKKSGFSKE